MVSEILAKQFFNLGIFRAAAETGSLSRAAASLGITQPAATRALSRLEAALGVKLLERSAGGVRPTEFGKIVLDHVVSASSAIERAGQDLASLRRKREGSVSCGAAPVNIAIIGAAADHFHRHYPMQSLRLIEGSTPDMIDLLASSELDVAVGSHIDEPLHEGLIVEPLLDEQIGVFARRDHPCARGVPTTLPELLSQGRWVFPDVRTHLHGFVHRELAGWGVEPPRRMIEARSPLAVRWFVQHTDCLAISTNLVHLPELRSGDVVMLQVDWQVPPMHHVLYRRNRSSMSRFAIAFVEAIKAEAARFRTEAFSSAGS